MSTFNPNRRRALQAGAVQLVAVGATFGWLQTRSTPADTEPSAQLLRRALALLHDSERLRAELLVSGDGLRRGAAQQQRLAKIAANDAALDALLAAHAPVARTAAFGQQAERFGAYVTAWHERWGALAASHAPRSPDPGVPEGLSEALNAELAAMS